MAKKKLTDIEKLIKETKLPELNYGSPNSVSYSQYSIYRRCPHQWYLTYIKNLAPYQASIHTVFGTAMHESLQYYFEIMYNQSGAAADRIDIVEHFKERFRTIYKEEYNKVKTHFSSPEEMKEFYEDGVAIIDWFKKNRNKYFSVRNMRLLGIEMPLMVGLTKNIFLKGYIDFVLYDEDLDKVIIYDIKTSRSGWNDKKKKDESVISQILLYKEFFAKQYKIDVDKIDVQYFIVKRKIWENDDYVIPRIQLWAPASGKIKRKQIMTHFEEFLSEAFFEDGVYRTHEQMKNVSKDNCTWCPFNDKPDLCDKNIPQKKFFEVA